MKTCTALIFLVSLCLSVTLPVPAQKRNRTRKTKPSINAPVLRQICQGDPIPSGFVIVEMNTSGKCGSLPELMVKKPAETEVVCDGSPVPAGYSVIKQEASSRCSSASPNPLNNALTISSDEATAKPAPKARVRNNDEDQDEERDGTSVRITVGRNGQSERDRSPLEQRAEEAIRQTRIANAVINHRVEIGLTKDMVLQSWGRPNKIETSVTADGEAEAWYYSRSNGRATVNFQNGLVSGFHHENR